MHASGVRKVPDYTNASVEARLVDEHGVDADTAARWFREALKFLDLTLVLRERGLEFKPRPSEPVDHAWHAFILHTRDYADYCESRFGNYRHHQPDTDGDDGDASALMDYLRTRALLDETFGADPDLWPFP